MGKDIGKKPAMKKKIATKGAVKLAAGGSAKERKGFPMTIKPKKK